MTTMVLLDAAIHCTLWGTNGMIRRNGVIFCGGPAAGRLKRWVLLVD